MNDPNRFDGTAAGKIIDDLRAELERVKYNRREDAKAYRRDIARLSAFLVPEIEPLPCAWLVINNQGYISGAWNSMTSATDYMSKNKNAEVDGLRAVPVYSAAQLKAATEGKC